jgi:hypothetical protein
MQQRFLELKINNNTLTSNKEIENYLYSTEFYWLLDCELDNVKLEIKDNILYWLSGTLYWGNWKWGVFLNGEFLSGNWYGGIFLNGLFKATWHNGVFKGGTFKGEKIKGQFPLEKI